MKKTLLILLVGIFLSVSIISSAYCENSILGSIEGNTYTNSYLGYGCTLENWIYYSEDEISQANQMTKELMKSASMNDLISDKTLSKQIIAMAAQSNTGLENLNIQFYYMPQYKTLLKFYGIEELIDSFTDANIDQLKEAFVSVYTVENLSADKTVIQLGTEEKKGLMLSYSMDGINVYQKSVCLPTDDFMVWITVTSMIIDTTDHIFQQFYSVK